MIMKKGLILEGGAMRGLFTAGVIDVMMESDIYPDGIAGVSAGAAFGCNYKSHQPGRVIRYMKRFADDSRFFGKISLLKTGDLINAKFAYHIIPNLLDKFDTQQFENDPMEFYIVATDMITGKPYYKICREGGDEFYDRVRASASMPLVSRIVNIDGKKLLDGGITDSIPLKFLEDKGYDRNIVVLTQPKDYVKYQSSALPLIRLAYRKYPKMVDAMAERHKMYNAQKEYVAKAENSGTALVICPEQPLGIAHITHDTNEMQRVYDLGRRAGEKHIGRIRDFWKITEQIR